MADELLDIADDSNLDPQDRRVKLDTRKWIAAKLKPRAYGDRLAVESTGKNGGPIEVEHHVSDLEFARRVAFALTKGARPEDD